MHSNHQQKKLRRRCAASLKYEKIIPKTPEQNGVSERLNRTLVESAKAMLLDLSKYYWAESIATATNLKNRCPTKSVQRKTP